MKESPILFNGAMVRAILDGKKTQTRRVMKPQPEYRENDSVPGKFGTFFHGWNLDHPAFAVTDLMKHCPYGELKGRRPNRKIVGCLWVRETFNSDWGEHTIYKANGGSAIEAGYKSEPKWKPSIHMPRWASRINLEITDIRVEQVQDISLDDSKSEGVIREPLGSMIESFEFLWNSINEKRGFGWGKNPWVWVVSFKRLPNE